MSSKVNIEMQNSQASEVVLGPGRLVRPQAGDDGSAQEHGELAEAIKKYFGMNGYAYIMHDKTSVYKHRDWRGFRDTLYDYNKWLELWGILGKWFLSHPVLNFKALMRYRWMYVYLTTPSFFDHCVPCQRGTFLRASRMNLNTIARMLTKILTDMFAADEHLKPNNKKSPKIVAMDAYMPTLFMAGFGNLRCILMHLAPHYLPSQIDEHFSEHYLDVVESYGVTPDVCGLPALEAGIAIEDDFPKFGCCYVSTNMPCDGSIMSSTILDRRFNMPTYVLNTPMRHTQEDTWQYSVDELKDCIRFIEEQSGEKYDYQLLREACERWNVQNQLRLEKWDMNKTMVSPHYGGTNYLYRIFTYQDACGNPLAIKNDQKVNAILQKGMAKPRKYPREARHRAIAWNTVANMYPALDEWLLNCWGIEVVFQFIEHQGHTPIDTSTDETMLQGVAKSMREATMRVHTKGGYSVYSDDLWTLVEQFNADMVILFFQISCKGTGAVNGLMEEEARRRGIRMVCLQHDLVDPRTISRRDMRDQISKYMETVMGETPVDPSLQDYDDSLSW